MQKRRLGRTGFDVSVLGLGCYQLTGEFKVSSDESHRITDAAYRLGLNLFDTAQFYGAGESEEIVGNIDEEAWAENGSLSARPVVHVTLAAAHRALDGYLGGRFLTSIKHLLQNPEKL